MKGGRAMSVFTEEHRTIVQSILDELEPGWIVVRTEGQWWIFRKDADKAINVKQATILLSRRSIDLDKQNGFSEVRLQIKLALANAYHPARK